MKGWLVKLQACKNGIKGVNEEICKSELQTRKNGIKGVNEKG